MSSYNNVLLLQTYIQENQLDAKMLSALLTGINRAFPFTEGNHVCSMCCTCSMTTNALLTGELESFEEHLNTLFKVVHVSPITTSIQVHKLI